MECGPLVYSTRDLGTSCQVTLRLNNGKLREVKVNARSLFDAASQAAYQIRHIYRDEALWPEPEAQVFCVQVISRKRHYHPRPYYVRGTKVIEWEKNGRPLTSRQERQARVEPFAPMRRRVLKSIK